MEAFFILMGLFFVGACIMDYHNTMRNKADKIAEALNRIADRLDKIGP